MATTDSPTPDKPSGSGPKLIIWLVIALVGMVYLLQKLGCGPVKTSEKIEWIDR